MKRASSNSGTPAAIENVAKVCRTGFRYLLLLEDGDSANPAAFLTAIPTWHVGDEFRAGSDLQKFRILALEPEMSDELARDFQATWTVVSVGPVGGS